MARPPKTIAVKESAAELQAAMRKAAPHLRVRLQMLLLLRQPLPMGKQALASALGVNPNSVQTWRTRYTTGGMELLLQDKRGGNKKAVIDAVVDSAIVAKLSDPLNAPRSFKELQQWVSDHHIKDINYHTLNKHVKKKHGAKIKVARKAHVNKDPEAAATFKKSD